MLTSRLARNTGLIAMAALLVFLAGCLPSKVTVPDVSGMTLSAAQSAITGTRLSVGTVSEEYNATVPAGLVIGQDPAGGTTVSPGTAMDLVMSKGPRPVTIPNVVGMTQMTAQNVIMGDGLSVGTVTQALSETAPVGQVISQDPTAGASVAVGTAVSLTVSRGSDGRTVPNVVGMTQSAAQNAITNASLTVGTVTRQSSTTVPAGQVISQSPPAGTSAVTASAVNLVVASGPSPDVPFSADITNDIAPFTVQFSAGSSLLDTTPTGWQWDFGDGGTSTEENPSHEYIVPGVYPITLIIAHATGAPETFTRSSYITVLPGSSAIVGTAGGAVATPSGSTAEIPAGILASNVTLHIADVPIDLVSTDIIPTITVYGSVIVEVRDMAGRKSTQVSPAKGVFSSVIHIAESGTTSLVEGTKLVVYEVGEFGQWTIQSAVAVVDATGKVAVATVDHAGQYVAAKISDFVNIACPTTPTPCDFFPATLKQVRDDAGQVVGTGSIPIVLLHGTGSYRRPAGEYARWKNLIDYALAGNLDLDKYQLWWFERHTDKPIGYDETLTDSSAKELRTQIDNCRQNKINGNSALFPPAGQQFLIVAHSQGGLVARAFMNKQNGADEVMAMITLATPHHGSPGAVPDWIYLTTFDFFPIGNSILHMTLGGSFNQYYRTTFDRFAYGEADLAWDNFDDAIPHFWSFPLPYACGEMASHILSPNDGGLPYSNAYPNDDDMELPSGYYAPPGRYGRAVGTTLSELNAADPYLKKIIFYGGYLSEKQGIAIDLIMYKTSSKDNDSLCKSCDGLDTASATKETWGLRGASGMMASIKAGEPFLTWKGTAYYAANDGMVPLQSALMLEPATTAAPEPIYGVNTFLFASPTTQWPIGLDRDKIVNRLPSGVPATHIRYCKNYTHLDMVEGLQRDGGEELFNSIVQDIDQTTDAAPTAACAIASQSGLTVLLDVSGSHDNDTTLPDHAPWPSTALDYRVDWDSSDGLTWSAWGTSSFNHTYPANGTYTISLQVRDQDGMMSSIETHQVNVTGEGTGELTITLPGGVPLVLVRIPAGSFQMGSPDTERGRYSTWEGPVHPVTIGYDFYMGKYELTQAQWLAVMGSWPGTAPSSGFGVGANYPAYYLSWDDARNFVTALNAHITATSQGPATMRLPSEAEWEYACRAGTQTRFYFGDSLGVGDACEDDGTRSQYMWYCGNNSGSYGQPGYGSNPVGGKLPNAFGLYDMSGNIWEWCEDDWHGSYTGAPTNGSAWIDSPTRASSRMFRGGYWSYGARYCRSAYRNGYYPPARNGGIGFRVAVVR